MKPRILFCSDVALTQKLGAAKVVVEVAECMEREGWDCRLAGPQEICPGLDAVSGTARIATFATRQRAFLQREAEAYDVVDYGHQYLPYSRQEFPARTLFVARSVLLTHHLGRISLPQPRTGRAVLRRMLRGDTGKRYQREAIAVATRTIQEADLVNVSNSDDRVELARYGIPEAKIVVLPFGISPTLRPLFDAVPSEVPEGSIVAFVGTFDYRKGAAEFPNLVASILKTVPGARFKLLGTRGLFQTAEQVLSHFSPALAATIEVVPEYAPEALPQLLADCCVGIFPSHVEGFGFGVVEMMAASLPVIAYNVPGPPMMLPDEYLVTRGDSAAMSGKVTALLLERDRLQAARLWAKQQSRSFDWQCIARQTSDRYLEALGWLRQRQT